MSDSRGACLAISSRWTLSNHSGLGLLFYKKPQVSPTPVVNPDSRSRGYAASREKLPIQCAFGPHQSGGSGPSGSQAHRAGGSGLTDIHLKSWLPDAAGPCRASVLTLLLSL